LKHEHTLFAGFGGASRVRGEGRPGVGQWQAVSA
jgi:hypothetical protein